MAKTSASASDRTTQSRNVADGSRRRAGKTGTQPVSSDPGPGYRVRVRMYRQGIGDAFLLSFHTGDTPAHILIDCGVLTGTRDGRAWMQNIAEDVARESAGQLHAIVGTHPHWDHLAGFYDAREQFQALEDINEVWLAWSENPQDPEGREQTRRRELLLDGARMALVQLAASTDAATRRRAAAIADILAFHGPADALSASGSRGTSAALEALRELVAQPCYCEPGQIMTPAWLPGVRIYVLGPPRDQKLLGKTLGKKGSEMYGLGGDTGFVFALKHRQAAGASDEADAQFDATCPFDMRLCWATADAQTNQLLKPALERYLDPATGWRMIDDEWLLSAEQLALQLDNVINNLSLVLAFELIDTGEVLLFSADAQIGNWLSWQGVEFKADAGAAAVKAHDLLARTVFYKVGHHGSHNGTLMQGGLEAMTHPGLVAAITVDQQFANSSKDWDMPQAMLYQALLEKTGGRLLRADGTGPTATDAGADRPISSDWESFGKRVRVDPGAPSRYVDYFLS
jgi:hypothetical protein